MCSTPVFHRWLKLSLENSDMWELFVLGNDRNWIQLCASAAVDAKKIKTRARKHQFNHLNQKEYNVYKITDKDGYDYAIGMGRNNGKKGRFLMEWTKVKPVRNLWRCVSRNCPGCSVCREEIK